MSQVRMRGAFPVMPTIFDDHGEIDNNGMTRVIEYIVESGATGLVYPGLASEVETLDHDERLRMTELVGARVNGRLAFIVGASAPSADDSIAFAKAGAAAGAVAAMVMTPRVEGGTPSLADFYDQLGLAAGIPIMLQNAPAPMGLGLSIEQVATVAREVDAVQWIKEETMPSGQRITQLRKAAGAALNGVYGGAGGRYVIDELRRGALGTMPACEISEVHATMLDRFEAGDEAGARELFDRTLPLLSMQAIYRWRLTKEVLRRRGLIESTYTRATGPALDVLDQEELGILLGRIDDLLTVSSIAHPMMEAAA